MSKVIRKGDTCVVFCNFLFHAGPRIGVVVGTCSTLTTIDGIPVARVGDKVLSSCGHTGTIVTGSSFVDDEGLKLATSDSTVGIAAAGERLYSGTFPNISTYSFVEHL